QEMVGAGIEIILSVMRDPLFGNVVMVGPGGVHAELYRRPAFRFPPVDAAAAEAMLHESGLWPLLTGYRGHPGGDIGAVVEAIMALS
ncbi:acetate--CoA ligase family protein, partial [Paraburkholderia sp. SIMBA_061]